MDTLGCAASLAALLVQVLTSDRLWGRSSTSPEPRPVVATVIVLILAALAVWLGAKGYHKDWPRWANGRAAFAMVVGGLLFVVCSIEAIVQVSAGVPRGI
jgi:hypothetical protein